MEKLDQILNDPGSMKQIMEMVSALGLQSPEQENQFPSPELAAQMTNVLHQAKNRDQKQENLIHALLPYLRPGKRRRLERAMQVAQLSHLAGVALQNSVLEHGEE